MKVDYDPLSRIVREPMSLEAFYRDHLGLVSRFVARRVSDPHTAADLTADIFVAAIDSCQTYDPTRGSVAAWLCGVGRHVVAAEGRQRCREESKDSRTPHARRGRYLSDRRTPRRRTRGPTHLLGRGLPERI